MTVLVLRALGLGDFLTAVPALRGLRRAYPAARMVLAAPRELEPLAALSGAIDTVLPARGLGDPLRLLRPEVAVNLHGRGPKSHRLLLATGPGRLIAFHNQAVPETSDAPRWCEDEHEVSRWCRLLESAGIGADPSDLDMEPPALAAAPRARGALLIHPGAGHEARRWPADRWIALAKRATADGMTVVITAGPGEEGLAAHVAAGARLDAGAVLSGLDLNALAATVAASAAVCCGDTGLAHLATTLGRPSVVLFGPTSPARWGPPSGRERHQVLWAGVEGDPFARRPDVGLLRIQPEDVLRALARALPARQ